MEFNELWNPRHDGPAWSASRGRKSLVTVSGVPAGTTQALRVTIDATGDLYPGLHWSGLRDYALPGGGGYPLALGGQVRLSVAGNVAVGLLWYQDGLFLSADATTVAVAANTWTPAALEGVESPPDANGVVVWFGTPDAAPAGTTLDVTNVMLNTGTAETLRTNLVPAPASLAGWGAARGTVALDAAARRTPSSPVPLKLTATDTVALQYLIQSAALRTDIVDGQPFTFSVWARPSAAGAYQLQVYEYDASGTLLTPVLNSPAQTLAAGAWARLAHTFTPKANTATCRVVLIPAFILPLGATLHMSEPLVEMGSDLGSYFDGSTPADPEAGEFYYWSGTPDASTSVASTREGGRDLLPFFDGDSAGGGFLYGWSGPRGNARSVRFLPSDTGLTATPDPDTGSILLTGQALTSVTGVLRSDANGTAQVRTLDGYLPLTGTLVIRDHEAALSGPVTYTLVGGGGASVTTSLDGGDPWLGVPVYPQHSRQVALITGYGADSASRATVHEPIGRRTPVVILGRLSARRGQLEVWCATHADALSVKAVYDLGQVVMLRQAEHAGLDMYHVATAARVDPFVPAGARTRWRVVVEYVEVDRPSDALAGTLGWDFDAVTATHATFSDLAMSWADFDSLTIGPLQ